jgi:hypothetical protein
MGVPTRLCRPSEFARGSCFTINFDVRKEVQAGITVSLYCTVSLITHSYTHFLTSCHNFSSREITLSVTEGASSCFVLVVVPSLHMSFRPLSRLLEGFRCWSRPSGDKRRMCGMSGWTRDGSVGQIPRSSCCSVIHAPPYVHTVQSCTLFKTHHPSTSPAK